jgi:hypothetical protein
MFLRNMDFRCKESGDPWVKRQKVCSLEGLQASANSIEFQIVRSEFAPCITSILVTVQMLG